LPSPFDGLYSHSLTRRVKAARLPCKTVLKVRSLIGSVLLWGCAAETGNTMLEQLQRSERDTLPTNFAHVHLGLGQFDTGLEWFHRVVEEWDKNMMPILSYAHFDPIQIHVSQSCARYSWRVGEDCAYKEIDDLFTRGCNRRLLLIAGC